MLKFHPLRIRAARADAEDCVSVLLEVPAELESSFRGRAGQHVVVRAMIGGADVRRTYTLVSRPGEFPLRIAARVHPEGLLSRWLAREVRPGGLLEVMPPNGSFGPQGPATASGLYVAFAAGSGITPVFAVTAELLARDAGARVLLLYGNRSAARTMLLEELLALKDRYLDRLALHFVMSREPGEIEHLNGRIDAHKVRFAGSRLFKPAAVREYFVCGPGAMMEEVGATLAQLGVAPGRIHSERFAVDTAGHEHAPLVRPVPGAAAAAPAAQTTQVALILDGRQRSFSMRTGDETILEAAARAGIELPFSCKAGVCATCRTKLVRGKVEMDENYALEDWELQQGFILACQARPSTPEIELTYDET
jgi:ring-1,2-phenylacetyl-CoA epoxidase subunit PaaE